MGTEMNDSINNSHDEGAPSLSNTDRQLLTFDEDLWDQLDRVAAFQKHGSSMVLGLQTFASGYKKLVK